MIGSQHPVSLPNGHPGTGVRHIINLGLHTHEKALPDEAGSVGRLGMSYTHMAVNFQNPTDEDCAKFCAAVEQLMAVPVHVHGIAHYGVSGSCAGRSTVAVRFSPHSDRLADAPTDPGCARSGTDGPLQTALFELCDCGNGGGSSPGGVPRDRQGCKARTGAQRCLIPCWQRPHAEPDGVERR